MNKTNSIITSASSKFFPTLLNLLGSIEVNYPDHPDIYIYDLGLFYTFRKELEGIPWVHILDVPHFVPHWRTCYTWKTYILNTPLTENNLYIDAGCQVLKPLDELFKKINTQGYLAVSQGNEVKIQDITPQEYIDLYQMNEDYNKKEIIAAGIFGFKKDSIIKKVTDELYRAGINGLSLGFSQGEIWKNKGVNKTNYIRDCKMFRHDTTLITLLILKYIENPIVENINQYKGENLNSSNQFIWNLRMNYKKLPFIRYTFLHKNLNFYVIFNRIYTHIFIFIKKLSNKIKQNAFILKKNISKLY